MPKQSSLNVAQVACWPYLATLAVLLEMQEGSRIGRNWNHRVHRCAWYRWACCHLWSLSRVFLLCCQMECFLVEKNCRDSLLVFWCAGLSAKHRALHWRFQALHSVVILDGLVDVYRFGSSYGEILERATELTAPKAASSILLRNHSFIHSFARLFIHSDSFCCFCLTNLISSGLQPASTWTPSEMPLSRH